MLDAIRKLRGELKEDIDTVFRGDPAAKSTLEVLTCYPGLHAIWMHRVAGALWRRRMRMPARLVSHAARALTGVEIHPGAKLGRRVLIDHGMGVVIGETAEIGNDVIIYTGAVFGGTSLKKAKRHPTVGNRVIVGTGATLLGNITVGDDVKVGSGSVVVTSVPPGSTVVGIPGKVIRENGKPVLDLEHGSIPDPVARVLGEIAGRTRAIEERLDRIEETGHEPRAAAARTAG